MPVTSQLRDWYRFFVADITYR